MSSFLRAMSAVIWKDLAAETRSRELLSAMLVFALLVILIFNFALELDASTRANVTSGVLWVTFVFAGTLGLNRSLAIEKDRGCLDGLLLAPVDRTAIYLGKAASNLVFILVVAAIVLPVYSILYNVDLFAKPGLLLVIMMGVAASQGALRDSLWFGKVVFAGFTLHPLVLCFAVSGSLMVSRIRFPKL